MENHKEDAVNQAGEGNRNNELCLRVSHSEMNELIIEAFNQETAEKRDEEA